MSSDIYVINRHGKKEILDFEKIHKVILRACDDITGVSASEIELRSHIQMSDGIKTKDIHKIMIKSAAELISEETPNYDRVAARLVMFGLRKEVYGQYEPPHLYDIVKKNVKAGLYDPVLMISYTKADYEIMNDFIKHTRDDLFRYAGTQQLQGKYLIQDRVTRQIYETPQVMYIMIAATLFQNENKDVKLDYVKRYYDAISTFKIGLPTPILGGARTPTKQFSSCVLLDMDDSLDSIKRNSNAIVDYISKRAGIGTNIGRLRPEGSPIRGGEANHTGLIPFIKLLKAATKSCSQGAIRGGSQTTYYPVWHYDFPELIVLKNNSGTEATRERHIDYAVQFNKLFYKRLIDGGNITLFSPTLPDLYDAFFNDQEKFERLYVQYENDPSVKKRVYPAFEIFKMFIYESKGTGRIYYMNVDHCNSHTPFDSSIDPIYMSNLCCEINLNTRPLGKIKRIQRVIKKEDETSFLREVINQPDLYLNVEVNTSDIQQDNTNIIYDIDVNDGRIALCTLHSFNWGVLKDPSEFEELSILAIRALDNLLEYQDYPLIEAKLHTEEYRPLGIGINSLAYFLAKNGVKYQDGSALELVDEWMEAMAYYLQKATIELAKERGACKNSHLLRRSKGVMIVDTYNKNVDQLVKPTLRYDWELLRNEAMEYGVRNATTIAHMPSESNSQLMNATSGVEPVRSLVTSKQSKDGVLSQVVPEIAKLKNKYDMLWDQKSPRGYLDVMAVIQKYTDQTISTNMSYDPKHYKDNKISLSDLMQDMLHFYKFGGKTRYYVNTNDVLEKIEDIEYFKKQEGLIVPVDVLDETECEACKL